MISAILIDDENRAIEGLKSLLSKYCPDVEIVSTAFDIDQAYQEILSKKPHLIFLDVDMPPNTGFDLLKKFDVLPFEVIFVTAYDHYAIEAIKFSALYYLLKPIKIDDLKDAIEKAKIKLSLAQNLPNYSDKILNDQGQISRIVIKGQQGIDLVELDDILYLKAENVYTNLVLKNNKKILSTKSLKDYELLLYNKGFFRIQKSYIVSLKHVIHCNTSENIVTVSNHDKISLSQNQKEEFLKLL